MRNILIRTRLLASVGVLSASIAAAGDGLPAVTPDGLHLIPDTKFTAIYAQPDTDLSQYARIYLLEPQVNFVKDYKRKQNAMTPNSVTDADMENIRKTLASVFMEEFKQELQNNAGYVLVEGVAEDVLVVRPAILDLDVISPETARSRNTRSAIASAGQMTLYMELIDSVSGDTLVKALDHKFDRSRVQINIRDSDRNEAAARKIL